ncbi:MAG: hypothetical protein KF799_10340 [Bdellovibrionales bacterium]|nr:hypothetical protein [Bdellovibrionales bacterium]
MRAFFLKYLVAGLCAFALGCTKGVPDFAALDTSNVPQPVFESNQTEKTIQATSGAQTPSITGTCDRKIRSIVAQVMDQDTQPGSLDAVSVVASVTCRSDGKFSFTLKGLTDLGCTLVEGKTYEVRLRGVTSAGISRESSLKIQYFSATGGSTNRLTVKAGGTLNSPGPRVLSSTNFKATLSIGNKMHGRSVDPSAQPQVNSSSGGTFKAKIGAAAAAN